MKQKFGVFILLGIIVGSILGVPLGAAYENSLVGVTLGALGGVLLGWYAAIIALVTQNLKISK